MPDESDVDDDARPLTPDERRALRRLIAKEPDILEVALNFSHLGWFAAAVLKIAKWVAALVGAIVIWNSYKSGSGLK